MGGAVGYGFRNRGWKTRFEVEGAYRRNGLDELTISSDGGLGQLAGVGPLNGLSTSDVEGHAQAFSGMANVWVDLPTGGTVQPFAGFGLGAANVSIKDASIHDEVLDENLDLADDSDFVFAWQVGGGIAWNFTPQAAATLEYRWFSTNKPNFDFEPTGNNFESEYSTHNIVAGCGTGSEIK